MANESCSHEFGPWYCQVTTNYVSQYDEYTFGRTYIQQNITTWFRRCNKCGKFESYEVPSACWNSTWSAPCEVQDMRKAFEAYVRATSK